MKITHMIAIAVLGCGPAPASPAWGQEAAKSEGRKVVASATATAFVAPDAARVTFAITTTEGTQRSAQEANAAQVKRMCCPRCRSIMPRSKCTSCRRR
jgi:uncharacterized protein YggE